LRCAITIIYNGLHHLQHGNFVERMMSMFDRWIIVEGHARPGGSTYWCNNLKYQSAESTDGTREYLRTLGVDYIEGKGFWESKDAQFQAGVDRLKEITSECTLWQVDADEWWTLEQLETNERALVGNVGSVGFHHVVGRCEDGLLLAKGRWGGGFVNRVWRWKGQDLECHEPATFKGQGEVQMLPEKFLHFSYYFEKDVSFKQKYYKGHEEVYKGWKKLQEYKRESFPIHIFRAFGRKNPIGRSNSRIVWQMWSEEEGVLL
jgi:hypothetical protein